MSLSYKFVKSPIGNLKLVASEQGLVAILWEKDRPRRVVLDDLVENAQQPILKQTEAELGEYFAGKRTEFTVPLDMRGTPFQKQVWEALLGIPYGETRTYGQLANQLVRLIDPRLGLGGACFGPATQPVNLRADAIAQRILPPGLGRDVLGPRLVGGPHQPASRRSETAQGWTVEASHDAYVPELGLRHERSITLSPQGTMITGADRLVPVTARHGVLDFTLRFHIHPDVRISRLEGGGILLKLPNGEGWRFRSGGGTLTVEESIYLGGDTVRRTEQLVVTGQVRDTPVEAAWVFEQIVV